MKNEERPFIEEICWSSEGSPHSAIDQPPVESKVSPQIKLLYLLLARREISPWS